MAFCSKCGSQIPAGAGFCPSCGAPVPPPFTGTQPPSSVSGLSALMNDSAAQVYWLRRLFAYVIDAAIVYLVIGLAIALTALPAFFRGLFVPGYSPQLPLFGAYYGTVASLLFILYFTIAEASYGKTIGKGILGLLVTKEGGQKPGLATSFLRNLSKIYWVLLLLDVVMGLALEVGYMKKYSDRFLGTKVVQG